MSRFRRFIRKLAFWRRRKSGKAKPKKPALDNEYVEYNLRLWQEGLSKALFAETEEGLRKNVKKKLKELSRLQGFDKSQESKKILKRRKNVLKSLLDKETAEAYFKQNYVRKWPPTAMEVEASTRSVTYRKEFEFKEQEIINNPEFVQWKHTDILRKLGKREKNLTLIRAVDLLLGDIQNKRAEAKTSFEYSWFLAQENYIKNLVEMPEIFKTFAKRWQAYRSKK